MEGPLSGEALSVPRRGAEGGRPHAGSLATLAFDADMPRAAGLYAGRGLFPGIFLGCVMEKVDAFFLEVPQG